jgi:hypothetical protein
MNPNLPDVLADSVEEESSIPRWIPRLNRKERRRRAAELRRENRRQNKFAKRRS